MTKSINDIVKEFEEEFVREGEMMLPETGSSKHVEKWIRQALKSHGEAEYKKGWEEALDKSFDEAEEISVIAEKNYDEGYRDAKAGKKHKPHDTKDDYCCACDYDIATLKSKIKSQEIAVRRETIKKVSKSCFDMLDACYSPQSGNYNEEIIKDIQNCRKVFAELSANEGEGKEYGINK